MKRKTDPLDSVAGQILENAKKSGLEINTAEDAENLMAHMLGRLLTQMLDGEMTNHLGYERGGKRVTENERNGHSSKTLKSSSLGNIRIDVPRDRKGEFEPRVVPKHKRQLAGFEDKVLALYARGLSTGKFKAFSMMNTVWRPVPNLSAMLRTPSFLRLKMAEPSSGSVLYNCFL